MATASGDRSAHFPAIEKKYGQPMSYWFDVMREIADQKYPQQVAYLKENYGFSQAHANALVLYSKGSTSSKRYANYAEYLAPLTAEQQAGLNAITDALMKAFPKGEIVLAWNQPQFQIDGEYIVGYSASKNHITIGPWLTGFVAKYQDRLAVYKHGTKTFQVPLDWKPDTKLLKDIVKDRLAELKASKK